MLQHALGTSTDIFLVVCVFIVDSEQWVSSKWPSSLSRSLLWRRPPREATRRSEVSTRGRGQVGVYMLWPPSMLCVRSSWPSRWRRSSLEQRSFIPVHIKHRYPTPKYPGRQGVGMECWRFSSHQNCSQATGTGV